MSKFLHVALTDLARETLVHALRQELKVLSKDLEKLDKSRIINMDWAISRTLRRILVVSSMITLIGNTPVPDDFLDVDDVVDLESSVDGKHPYQVQKDQLMTSEEWQEKEDRIDKEIHEAGGNTQ